MDHGRESKIDLKANTNVSLNKRDSFSPLISLVDSDLGSGSQPESEINIEETEIGRDTVQSSDSSGRSSTSSNSSSGDFFQVIPHMLPRSRPSNFIPKPNGGIKQLYKNDEVDVSNEALNRLEESFIDSLESTSQFSDITHESLLPQMSPTQSPFIQVMERPGKFDPSRIPSSIFSKPLSPMEWSVASNESLFSIHIGNHSFRHASKKSKELYRSGELLISEEPFNFNQIYQSGELYKSEERYQSEEPFKSGDPKRTSELSGFELNASAKEGQPGENVDMTKNLSHNWNPRGKGATDASVDDISKAHINQGGINLGEPKVSISTNRLPDRSEDGVKSVTFPKKKKKTACSSCHSSHCRLLCCSCKWPIRLFGRLSCSNSCLNSSSYCCGWPKCQCKWPGCCWKFSWPSCPWKLCWPSCNCKCFSCPSCHCCCKCSSWPSCCCNCSSWPCCKCHCLDSSWLCCCCWKSKPKTSSHDSSYILAGSRMAYPSQ